MLVGATRGTIQEVVCLQFTYVCDMLTFVCDPFALVRQGLRGDQRRWLATLDSAPSVPHLRSVSLPWPPASRARVRGVRAQPQCSRALRRSVRAHCDALTFPCGAYDRLIHGTQTPLHRREKSFSASIRCSPEPTLYRHRLAIGELIQAVVVPFALQIGTPPVRRPNLRLVLLTVPMRETDCIKLGIVAADWALMAGVAFDNWFDCHAS